MPTFSLSLQQLVDKLEEIAADDRNRAAQISAIKELRAIRGGAEVAPAGNSGGLYDVSNPGRIRTKAS